ncbi:MAG: DUF2062 domain-containing protein [Xenococcaceae cyanobacterium]
MSKNFRRDKSRLPVAVVEKMIPRPFKSKRTQPWWLRRWRYLYMRFLRLRGTPRAIARGLAIGVFAGFFPLFGFQIIIGVVLAALLRSNKFAAAASTWISNPLTYVPIFVFNFKVGQLLLGSNELSVAEIDWQSLPELMKLGSAFIWTLFIGCFVVGFIAAFCTYLLSLRLIIRWRKSRQSWYRHRHSYWRRKK